MTYDFDKIIQRRGTNCVKWDEVSDNDTIPMWVADMDFETAPCIMQALQERLQHGCFGYTFVPESYYDATIKWFQHRHGWTIDRSSFIYTSGVVPAISAIIKAMTAQLSTVNCQLPRCWYRHPSITASSPAFAIMDASLRRTLCGWRTIATSLTGMILRRTVPTLPSKSFSSAIPTTLQDECGHEKSWRRWAVSASSMACLSSATKSIANSPCQDTPTRPSPLFPKTSP